MKAYKEYNFEEMKLAEKLHISPEVARKLIRIKKVYEEGKPNASSQ